MTAGSSSELQLRHQQFKFIMLGIAVLPRWFGDAPISSGIKGPPPATTVWHNAQTTVQPLLGMAYPIGSTRLYQRLPSAAQYILCNNTAPCAGPCGNYSQCTTRRCGVWQDSITPTGLHYRFSTTASTLHFRWRMHVDNGDWLWPINGHSGIDVYMQDETTSGKWRWATSSGNNQGNRNGSIAATALAKNTGDTGGNVTLTSSLGVLATTTTLRNFTLYLPGRGELVSVEIGVAAGETIHRIAQPAATSKDAMPIVVYGTSILHAAAVARNGMVYSSQMQRILEVPVANLGFSGLGLMQREVADFIGAITNPKPRLLILDCEFNMQNIPPENVLCATMDFIRTLRKTLPDTPILLTEGHDHTQDWLIPSSKQNLTRNAYRTAFNRLHDPHLFYLNGSLKLGGPIATDFEARSGAIGGTHVSNYAFTHFATYIGAKAQGILNGSISIRMTPLPLLPVDSEVVAAEAHRETAAAATATMKWTEAADLHMEGLGFTTQLTEMPRYGRFPASAQQSFAGCSDCSYTYNLSQCTAGVLVRFETDATQISINVTRRSLSGSLALGSRQDDIMPWNGRFGIDVYAADEVEEDSDGNQWRWFATSGGGSEQEHEMLSFANLKVHKVPSSSATNKRAFTVHFPTHIAVDSLQIGVPQGTSIAPFVPPSMLSLDTRTGVTTRKAPIVVWASSIGQGGVVANAGMPWISTLGRLLGREVLNLGFSGNCRMQPEVAAEILKINNGDIAMLIVDCLPNMDAALVTSRATPLFEQLRRGLGAATPLVILEGHDYTNAWALPSIKAGQAAKRKAQKTAFDERIRDKHIHYVKGEGKLASFDALGSESRYEAAGGVGVHPTNIAHYRIGKFVAEQVKPLLLD